MPRTTNLNNKPLIGKVIGTRLKEMDKTQKWLAQEARLSKNYIYDIINGRAIPSLAALKKISKPLGIDTFDLVGTLFGENRINKSSSRF